MKRLVVGLMYAGVFAAEAASSYVSPIYEFYASGLILALGALGAAVTWLWRRRELTRVDWLLVAGLVAIGLASYPNTSRDWLRYLFDGEMIRLWHLSPYVHLPYELPADQYSRVFNHIWWTTIPSPYGPLWQAGMVVVNYVSGNHLIGGVVALKLLNLGGLVLAARYLYLITGKGWIAYCFVINPIVLMDTVATPHTDIVMAAVLLGAYYHGAASARGVLLSGAGLIKAHGLIFLPFLAKGRRDLLVLGAWTTASLAGLLLILKPLVGFDWTAMLKAGQGGGVTGMQSLLMYELFPKAPPHDLFLASYGLFFVAYAIILGLFWGRRLSVLSALALVSLLVPFCLTGVLLPWHFIIPLAFLLICERPLAMGAVLFFTLVAMRSAMSVLQLIILMALMLAGFWVLRRVSRKVSNPPAFMRRLAG